MEIMPTIDVTPFLQVIDMALNAAFYTVVWIGGLAIGYMIGSLLVTAIVGDDQDD